MKIKKKMKMEIYKFKLNHSQIALLKDDLIKYDLVIEKNMGVSFLIDEYNPSKSGVRLLWGTKTINNSRGVLHLEVIMFLSRKRQLARSGRLLCDIRENLPIPSVICLLTSDYHDTTKND